MARFYTLPRGPRVCLRLARPRDVNGISDLFRAHGHDPEPLELARLVRSDPRQRLIVCATALVDGLETIVGVGEIDLRDGAETDPAFVLVDEDLTEGLAELLTEALAGRAHALRRDHAA